MLQSQGLFQKKEKKKKERSYFRGESLLLFLFDLFSVGVGGQSIALLEALNEIALAGKAATLGDLGNGKVGMGDQKLAGASQAEIVAKAAQRLSRDVVEIVVDLGNTDMKHVGDLLGG